MTRRVAESEQGQLRARCPAWAASPGSSGPGLFTLTFAWFIGARGGIVLPGAPLLLAALLMLVSLAVAWRATRAPGRRARWSKR